jgi:hypothetical protein
MSEWLQEWLGGIALAVVTGVSAWLIRLSALTHKNRERLSVMEVTLVSLSDRLDETPDILMDIREEIKSLRREAEERGRRLNERMESMRLEIKHDLHLKADKS